MPSPLSHDALQRFAQYESARSWPSTYVRPGHIDAWMHRHARRMILPLLQHRPGARWLTVGDGYYGADAHFLITHGAQATASALSAEVLQEAQHAGWISEWQVENAEALTPDDAAFDYLLCIETLQHCAQPRQALAEMLRVTNKGLVIMGCMPRRGRLLDKAREFVRARLRRSALDDVDTYQGVPLYRLAPEELAGHARDAGCLAMAFKAFNLAPFIRYWQTPAHAANPYYWLFKAALEGAELASRTGLLSPSLGWFVLLKEEADQPLKQALQAAGFEWTVLQPPRP